MGKEIVQAETAVVIPSLSKESLINEGIEIKLSQADLIEMLVADKLSLIDNKAEALNKEYDLIKSLVNAEYETAKEKQELKITIPKGLSKKRTSHSVTKSKQNYSLKNIYKRNDSNSGRTLDVFRYTSNVCGSVDDDCIIEASITVETITEDIQMTGHLPYSFKFKHSKGLIERIKNYQVEFDLFIKSQPKEGYNEKLLTKEIKNNLTKEVIRNTSKEFKESLRVGFGTIL